MLPYLDNGIVGVMKAAKEKGVKGVAVWTDLSKNWPEENLVSVVMDFGEYLVYAVEMATAGKLERKDYRLGLGTKAGRLGKFNPVIPEKVKTEILKAIEDMKSGKLKI
jgi:basic membrane lipoprotein Med (substrate-binding protein (PBP1-ABC) superfamily)